MNPLQLFDEAKTTQVAARFLQLAGGALNVLKLMKLLYLAERRTLAEFAVPLTGDVLVSMHNGPVLSRTLKLINGELQKTSGDWYSTISDRADHLVSLKTEPSLGALSRADRRVIEETWHAYGHLNQWELVDYCHKHLPEWEDPGFSSTVIPLRRVLTAVGFGEEQIGAALEALEEQAALAEGIERASVAPAARFGADVRSL